MVENLYGDAESIADKRMGPGILMMSSSMQLLYSDRRIWELFGKVKTQEGKAQHGVLPPAVEGLCSEIIKLLQVRTAAKDWEHFRVKRVVGDPVQPILLSGVGIPEQHGGKSRVLITVEALGRRQEAMIEQAKELFRLTTREVSVVQHLLKGWTNKEIASALTVTEQTIKEHIKHIMAKTQTTTRTGILVHVLRL
ncbi:MAG: LuxR C-terminal-related transcriptional regulator [Nitrospirota bacterium]